MFPPFCKLFSSVYNFKSFATLFSILLSLTFFYLYFFLFSPARRSIQCVANLSNPFSSLFPSDFLSCIICACVFCNKFSSLSVQVAHVCCHSCWLEFSTLSQSQFCFILRSSSGMQRKESETFVRFSFIQRARFTATVYAVALLAILAHKTYLSLCNLMHSHLYAQLGNRGCG